MPIDRCGFSSWRDRKKSPRPGGTCGERGEEPPARLDAVPAAGSARRGAEERGCGSGSGWERERAAALTGSPSGAGPRRRWAALPGMPSRPRGAEAARLRLRRSLRLGHRRRRRCSAPPGSAPKFLFPIFRPALYNKSFLFTKTVVIRPRVNRMWNRLWLHAREILF